MKEIGGYLELERYSLPMLHENAYKLNYGRSCLLYLIKSKKIKRILLPKLICSSITDVCEKEGVDVRYYSIDSDFMCCSELEVKSDEWLYVINYYGQIDNLKIAEMAKRYRHIIVDNAHAYFQEPVQGIDTLYICRKYFGVPDGAILYTDGEWTKFERDESFRRMGHLLGRFERNASEFYLEYKKNEEAIPDIKIKRMSKLTENLLHAIDYDAVEAIRTNNYTELHRAFKSINKLDLSIPDGSFMYPLWMSEGDRIREKLRQKKIYIPLIWPNVLDSCKENEIEYDMAKNILPIPVDQRYSKKDMDYIVEQVKKHIE